VVGERFGPYPGSLSHFEAPTGSVVTYIPGTPFSIGERVTVVLTSQVRSIDQVPIVPYAWIFTTECEPGPVSFSVDSLYFAARLPFEMYATDVNRDGYPDFAVAHTPSLAGTLSVFTDVADGTLDYALTTVRRTAAGPRGVHCGDFNGDAFPDIALTTSADSSFLILRNDQMGGFPDTTRYKTTILAYNIVGSDFDADGDMDLAMGNLQGPQILIARNDGLGTFGDFMTIVADSSPRGMEASDVDGDGDLDLVAVNANQKVSVFRNTGGGAFGPDTTYAVGLRPLSVYVNDLNGDGHPDIAVSNVQGGSISLLFNQGAGTFSPATNVVVDSINVGPNKNTLFEVYGNDLDGDGDIDLATADWFTGRYFVLSNSGSGEFQIALESDSIGVGLQNIVGGDLDADGDVDLVLSNWSTGGLRVLRNGSTDALVLETAPAPYSLGAPAEGEVTARFSMQMASASMSESSVFLGTDLRGRLEIQTLYDSSQRTLRIIPSGTLLPGEAVTATLGPGIVAVIGSPLAPFRWDFVAEAPPAGRGFVLAGQPPLASAAAFVLPGAFGGGEGLDFAGIRRLPGGATLYLNQGGLAFAQGPSKVVGGRIAAACGGDFDADGDPDIALADDQGNMLRVLGASEDSLHLAATLPVPGQPAAVRQGDMNNDGLEDLLYTVKNPRSFGIWWNAPGGFGSTQTFPLPATPRQVVPFDKDLDGDLDVAVLTELPARVRLYRHFAGEVFLNAGTLTIPVADPSALEAADVTGDGLPDLVVADRAGSSVVLLRADGAGGFVTEGPFPAAAACASLRLADLDGDEAMDILSTGLSAAHVGVLFGDGGGGFGLDSIYALGLVPGAVTSGDFSGDGRQEICVTASLQGMAMFLESDHATGVGDRAAAPGTTRLLPARPNPAKPLTEIMFELSEPARGRLRVYDVQGALVRTLLDGPLPAGPGRVFWDGRDRQGRKVPSGVYLYRFEAGSFSGTGRVVIIR
jgi:hypothetical protein